MTKQMKMTLLLKRMLSMQRPHFSRISFCNDFSFQATTKRRKYSTKDIAMMALKDLNLALISWTTMGNLIVINNNNDNSYYYLITTYNESDTL